MSNRLQLLPENDPNFIHLLIHRVILISLLLVLGFLTFVMVFTSVVGIKSDDESAGELREMRKELDEAQRIIDNANDISRGSIEFQRCAFLIEPDVQKTEKVLDTCIKRANLPPQGGGSR
jgi:hypothetical protein